MDKKIILITKLLVNPEKPRFEPVKNETDAINLIIIKAGFNLYNLAKDIVPDGLNLSKNLMVVKSDGGNFLRLEGKYRIVVLKLLHNLKKTINTKLSDKFREFKKEFGTQISNKVECVVFFDKENAFRWVNLEHTEQNKGISVLSCNGIQQQRFIAQYAGRKPSCLV